MCHTLFGIETEYACVPVVVLDDDEHDELQTAPDQMMERARRTLTHLDEVR